MEAFGIRLVGFNQQTLHKLLLSLGFIVGILAIRMLWLALVHAVTRRHRNERVIFWIRQGTNLVSAVLICLSLLSTWFDNPSRLATGLGFFTAGLAFALQKVITAFAGYLVILRGKTFSVGDRITLGGVRGDVISLGFIQTRIMEMGQPPAVQSAAPAMWVKGRQYTGRIVTVTNDKIFDEPVYNYTREFPYLWEEIAIPITYASDRRKMEQILLESAARFTERFDSMSDREKKELEHKYFIHFDELTPQVFYRLTDNWLELAVRFIVRDHGVRDVKNKMSRFILDEMEKAGIGVASSTFEIVGLPPLRIDQESASRLTPASA